MCRDSDDIWHGRQSAGVEDDSGGWYRLSDGRSNGNG